MRGTPSPKTMYLDTDSHSQSQVELTGRLRSHYQSLNPAAEHFRRKSLFLTHTKNEIHQINNSVNLVSSMNIMERLGAISSGAER